MTTPASAGMLRRGPSGFLISAGISMLNLTRKWILLALLAATGTAAAQGEEPQRPEAVYRYAVFDSGDAIERLRPESTYPIQWRAAYFLTGA